MSKIKTVFFCQNCGYQSPKWLGKCPSCSSWNTLVEEVVEKNTGSAIPSWKTNSGSTLTRSVQPKEITSIVYSEQQRIHTKDEELNRVLGGGIVPGSLVLIGGDPGIGKSTLMLQLALTLPSKKVLYVSGEESEQQIKMRGNRLEGIPKENSCYILTETQTQNIFRAIDTLQPSVVIIDSIQTLYSPLMDSIPGSVSQVRQCTAELLKFAKESNIPVFLIGHITKDGSIAGPKVLEHMVDTVLQFEGDRHYTYRILRSIKNRFGSASEMGIYEMQGSGLREVSNPSEILLSHREEALSGVTISATIEGIRPILIETQALVSPSVYGTPQRSSTGFDTKRMNMLLAVLEKRGGLRLGMKDVFVNITGGIRIEDPALDLGLLVALISSSEDMPVSYKTCFAAEIGLSGEVRAVNRIEQRIAEAEKLGFDKIFISKYNIKGLKTNKYSIKIIPVSKIDEVFNLLFG